MGDRIDICEVLPGGLEREQKGNRKDSVGMCDRSELVVALCESIDAKFGEIVAENIINAGSPDIIWGSMTVSAAVTMISEVVGRSR